MQVIHKYLSLGLFSFIGLSQSVLCLSVSLQVLLLYPDITLIVTEPIQTVGYHRQRLQVVKQILYPLD